MYPLDAEHYIKRGRIYVQLGDLSSGIAHFHKALMYGIGIMFRLNYRPEWEKELGVFYYIKGMAMIESGDTTDALDFIKGLKIDDFKFIYLR